MKVIKKPIIVEAWQLKPYRGVYIPRWVSKAILNKDILYNEASKSWFINSLEGTMLAHDGDYLIKGAHDELYPCREDIFNDTYTILKEDKL